jgi:hypothetical protein
METSSFEPENAETVNANPEAWLFRFFGFHALPPVKTVIESLRGISLRCRTGILLLSPADLAQIAENAARLEVESFDYIKRLTADMPPGSTKLDIDGNSEILRLQCIANEPHGSDPVIVADIDFALAKMPISDRTSFWNALEDRFPHRNHGILLAIPTTQRVLLPSDEALERWRVGGRLTRL